MLKQQLAKGNNGLVRTKYITFSIEAKSVKEAKPRLERIETDILNNFKVLGVKAYPLNGVERLQIMYEMFHQEEERKFEFSYDRILQSGMTTKDFIAPTSFLFKSGKDFKIQVHSWRRKECCEICGRDHCCTQGVVRAITLFEMSCTHTIKPNEKEPFFF